MVFLTASCRTYQGPDSPDSAIVSQTQTSQIQVFSLCFATQGNGFNYPSILSWIAETLYLNIEQARQAAVVAPEKVRFDISCLAGSSSGSLVANIVGALLTNPSFIKKRHPEGLLTGEQVARLADGLRWMALSADLSTNTYLNAVNQVISLWVENAAQKALGTVPGIREIWAQYFGPKPPEWWDGAYIGADEVLTDFVANVLVAKKMTFGTFHERDETGKLVHFPYFSPPVEIPKQSFKVIDQALQKRAKAINNISEAFLQNQFALGQYLGRYQVGVYGSGNSPLKKMAEEPLEEGTCTLTMGVLAGRKDQVPMDRLSYGQIRPMAFCSPQTIRKILSQDSFKADIKIKGSFARRLILFAANNRRVSMAMSLREPHMMRPYLGNLGDLRAETSAFFDPEIPAHLAKLDLMPSNGERLGIAGGYLDRRMTAWLISYYHESRINFLRSQGYQVVPRIYLFGKPDKNREKKFDYAVIRQLFSRSETDATNHFADWVGMQRDFCDLRAGFLGNKYLTKVHTTAYNWDINKLPAAVSGQSRYLAYKSANAVRLQTPEYRPLKLAFDPLPDSPETTIGGEVACFQ